MELFDVVPGWAWALSLLIGLPAAFSIPIVVFGWRTLFGTNIEVREVEVVREVRVGPGWNDGTNYHELPPVPECPVDTGIHYLKEIFGGSGWEGEQTGVLPVVDLDKPEPQPVDADPAPDPRQRFSEPESPIALMVTTKLGDTVLSDRIEVPAA